MKKIVAVLMLFACVGGCAQVQKGLCWVDKQIPACEWAGEPAPAPVKDHVPGGGN